MKPNADLSYSRFPINEVHTRILSLFPVPCSLFPLPYSLFPVPYSLSPSIIVSHLK
ncbi:MULTISPECIES: hypothetical protein [Moorena]|uniref:hypothetical protein n=1 Tax=Moorena TaxID=1155738 RepID=UPI000303538B|nr:MULTISPECIES: hypothetical protein [Moorena]NEP35461.1 hypothetical protein [Moorena sp. SIO3B2]NEQ15693.1 hypothetical protein [Moorena sp. SIO3E2]NET64735.1 hypothetical protein [Moorena sp. SIO1G6]